MGRPTVGYKYHLGVHMVMCHGPIDAITRVDVDGRRAWTGEKTDNGVIGVVDVNLFGGEEREGGVAALVDIAMGGATQTKNDYLVTQLGEDIPAYRGVVSAIIKHGYLGMNPYIKRWAFWGRRIMKRSDGSLQWFPERAAIGNDMNGAHILRECLTDRSWGMGYPEADIDETSFRAAAVQLHAEGMGISLLWDKAMPIGEFMDVVMKHIDGVLYTDRATGKFVLKLARGGYDIDSLLLLDEDSIERVSDFKRNTVGELANSVTVVFWDASSGKNNSVTVQDIALAAQQGATVGTTVQYPGFTNGTIASRVASRDLKALSTPLAQGTIYANRKAAALNVGDVFRFSWPRYGIVQMVMRVVNMELGELGANLVKLTVVEDAFALSSAVYAPPPASEWSSPMVGATPSAHHVVFESPFWELVQRLGETTARAVDATAGFVQATAVRATAAISAKLFTNPTGTLYEEAATVDFCPTCLLAANVSPNQVALPIVNGSGLDQVRVGSYAMLDAECVSIVSVTDTVLTVGRGVLDTVPAPHLSNARLFFVDDFSETDGVEYAQTETARVKICPTTGLGTLPVEAAPEQSVVITARAARPYPPGKLRLNAQAYPVSIPAHVDLAVAWTHRDRLQQTAALVDTEAASIGPEVGTTYAVEVRTADNTLVASGSALPGAGTTIANAALGPHYGPLTVALWAERAGVASHQAHRHTLYREEPPGRLMWRLNVTENQGAVDFFCNIAEMTLHAALGGPNIAVGGLAAASSEVAAPQRAAMAFDGSASTFWSTTAGGSSAWLRYQLAAAANVLQYTIQAGDTAGRAARAPKSWTLEYSETFGASWVVAHTVVGEAAFAAGETRTYTI